MMKQIIVNEVKISGIYALMVDSTQDIVGHEQSSIVVRYVNRTTLTIHERLIGLLRLKDTSGEGYFDNTVTYLDKFHQGNPEIRGKSGNPSQSPYKCGKSMYTQNSCLSGLDRELVRGKKDSMKKDFKEC